MPDRDHRIDASGFFRRAWSLYDTIVESNHMHHREIYAQVERIVSERASHGPLRVLDLGCGNARCMAPVLRRFPPDAYLGVDLSESALSEAEVFLHGLGGVELKCCDLLEHAESEHSAWTMIFSGFAVHHLSGDEKNRLFHGLHSIISPGGFFLMADVVRDEGTSREEHVASYTAMMRRDWHGIPSEALEEGCAHVTSYDFPSTPSELLDGARNSGFDNVREVSRHGMHRVFLFSK
jgi:SAM-dependent methyltransferase